MLPTALNPELFLPEPEPTDVRFTVISVDDHVVEPPHMFEGRLPVAVAEAAPRIVETPEGRQMWTFEGNLYTQVGMNAVAGRRPETVKLEPFRFEQMRPGCYDPHARIHDMDLGGIWASMNFPSQISGFCGRVFFNAADRPLGEACIRAWNDWLFEEWYTPYPERIIPLGVAMLTDPAAAVAEIHRNAARGFTAVSQNKPANSVASINRAPGYVKADALVEYRINQGSSLKLNIDNLFDKVYYNTLYRGFAAPGDARSVRVTLTSKF